jgi:predicted TIM-barrel fold metal-dependent hydrolase
MDRHFDDNGVFNDTTLKMLPSEYFKRQCWIAFEPVEGSLTVLADYLGPDRILWATDYPHPDGFFPGAPAMIANRPELSAETKSGVLAGGAKAFYGLQ